MADSDEEFFDCADDATNNKSAQNGSAKPTTVFNRHTLQPSSRGDSFVDAQGSTSKWGGRHALPAHMFSRSNFSVWSFLKQCIGKELSKITMPVIFNEPLSFLQRVVEYMEYGPLLSRASSCDDPVERLELVTAFAVSATASNWQRIGKPFNPLLGETYELDRPDLGIRIVCEQVSHHPPVSAFHVDSELFSFHGSINPKLKFWGKSVEVTPKGVVTLFLKKHNEVYSWHNVNCCVHNIIVGKIWIEHYGAMEVTNHTKNWKSVVNYRQSGWFGRDLHKLDGFLYDNNKKKLRAFYGKWVDAFYSIDVEIWDEYVKASATTPSTTMSPSESTGKISGSGSSKDRNSASEYNSASRSQLSKTHSVPSMTSASESDFSPDDIPLKGSCDLNLPGQKLLWRSTPKPANADQYYSFTEFAYMLNEFNDEIKQKVAPTDSRWRPDMRKMEEGDIDASADEKNRIEELQRNARKDRKKSKDDSAPLWFKYGTDPYTGKEDWLFTGEYWKRDWTQCPRIY